MPGVRDQHTGCVGAYLVEHDLFDFLLFSLPDNDAWSHKNGPHAQVTSIAAADRQLERLMHAAGGPERFLDDHAVIVTSDHSQAIVEERIRLHRRLQRLSRSLTERRPIGRGELAISPAQRSAMVYALDLERRDELVARSLEVVREVEGIDLTMWLTNNGREAAVCGAGGDELRFAPGASVIDSRGLGWEIDAAPGTLTAVLGARVDGRSSASRARLPGRAGSDLVGAELRDRRRRAAVGRARLRVRRLGRSRPRRRRQPRLAAPHRFARRDALVRGRSGLP